MRTFSLNLRKFFILWIPKTTGFFQNTRSSYSDSLDVKPLLTLSRSIWFVFHVQFQNSTFFNFSEFSAERPQKSPSTLTWTHNQKAKNRETTLDLFNFHRTSEKISSLNLQKSSSFKLRESLIKFETSYYYLRKKDDLLFDLKRQRVQK